MFFILCDSFRISAFKYSISIQFCPGPIRKFTSIRRCNSNIIHIGGCSPLFCCPYSNHDAGFCRFYIYNRRRQFGKTGIGKKTSSMDTSGTFGNHIKLLDSQNSHIYDHKLRSAICAAGSINYFSSILGKRTSALFTASPSLKFPHLKFILIF